MTDRKIVLVVEDDELVSTLALTMLEALGYTAHLAVDGAAALEMLGRIGADILFTDIELPGAMNGRALARAAQARWPELRTVYVSGDIGNALPPEGLGPFERALAKPYRKGDLEAVLGDL